MSFSILPSTNYSLSTIDLWIGQFYLTFFISRFLRRVRPSISNLSAYFIKISFSKILPNSGPCSEMWPRACLICALCCIDGSTLLYVYSFSFLCCFKCYESAFFDLSKFSFESGVPPSLLF